MCSIVGMIDKSGKDVANELVKMLKLTLHRGPDGSGLCIDNKIVKQQSIEGLNIQELKGSIGIGSNRLKIVGSQAGAQPLTGCLKGLSMVFNGEIYNYKEIIDSLKDHEIRTDTDAECIIHLFEDCMSSSNLADAIRNTVRRLDGMYAFAIMHEGKLILCRDPIGIKPVYLVNEDGRFAFASERKALWALGVSSGIKPLLPGHALIVSRLSYEELQVMSLINVKNSSFNMLKNPAKDIAKDFLKILRKAVDKMVNVDKIGVLFSGGLDSSLIACLCNERGANVTLYCSGLPNSKDIKNAKHVAEILGLKLRVKTISLDELERRLPEIIFSLEERNILNLSISIPTFFSTALAKEDGVKVMLSGQGADELLGGYKKYEYMLRSEGYEKLHTYLLKDLVKLYEVNLQRDDSVSMANSVEVRFPFLDKELVSFSIKIPVRYKVAKEGNDLIRKYILRLAAKELGIPSKIAEMPKLAIQFGSGSYKALKLIAKKKGFNERLAKEYGYANYMSLFVDWLAYRSGMPLPEHIFNIMSEISLNFSQTTSNYVKNAYDSANS